MMHLIRHLRLCLSGSKLTKCQFSTSSMLSQSSRVGFIGLGNMGAPMAENLIKKGESVCVYDVSPEAAESLRAAGAAVCASPAALAEQSDRIVSMLPNSQHVQHAYTGADGVFSAIRPGTLVLDSSTIDPKVSQEMAQLADGKDAVFMDSPVSGGVPAARAGSLTFMVGGPEASFAAAERLLRLMGQNVVHCGPVGSGQTVKICNNMLLAISMIGTAETMNLGVRLGLDAKLLAKILSTSTGRCWAVDTYNPVPGVLPNVPSSNEYQGGFGTALMCKDLGLAQAAAAASQSATPLGAHAHQIYRMLVNQGLGKLDFGAVYKYLSHIEEQ